MKQDSIKVTYTDD